MSTDFLAYVVVQCSAVVRESACNEYGGRLRFGRRFWCSFLVPGQQKTHFNGCDETGSAVADLDMYSYIQRLRLFLVRQGTSNPMVITPTPNGADSAVHGCL